MRISFGDKSFCWRNQSGQGITEYLLVLFVTVVIIMTGIWQLSGAFKVWANSYFGDYLSCVLETGELPNVGGNGAGPGTCETLFEPFSLAKGRPLRDIKPGGGEPTSNGPSRGEGEGGGGGNARNAPHYVASSGGRGGGRFASGRGAGASSTSRMKVKSDGDEKNGTGNVSVNSAPNGYRTSQIRTERRSQILDSSFAYANEREEAKKPRQIASSKGPNTETRNKSGIVKPMRPKQDDKMDDEPMTIGGFLRILIIAAIIIALIMFLGGQALQMSKSMEQ